ncbi:hypothetical protein SUGI_0941500 [Cryptomeria japonica]|nr:hypothetical protein SUGI_0941500 [Cryptomeria japonica]
MKTVKQQLSKELQRGGRDNKKVKIKRECCCMCGDVGFEEKLFRCKKCSYRFQHIYCSQLFTSLENKVEICEWCLETESKERIQQNSTKRKSHAKDDYQGNHESGCRAENSKEIEGERCNSNLVSRNVQSSHRGLGQRYRLLSEVLCQVSY